MNVAEYLLHASSISGSGSPSTRPRLVIADTRFADSPALFQSRNVSKGLDIQKRSASAAGNRLVMASAQTAGRHSAQPEVEASRCGSSSNRDDVKEFAASEGRKRQSIAATGFTAHHVIQINATARLRLQWERSDQFELGSFYRLLVGGSGPTPDSGCGLPQSPPIGIPIEYGKRRTTSSVEVTLDF